MNRHDVIKFMGRFPDKIIEPCDKRINRDSGNGCFVVVCNVDGRECSAFQGDCRHKTSQVNY